MNRRFRAISALGILAGALAILTLFAGCGIFIPMDQGGSLDVIRSTYGDDFLLLRLQNKVGQTSELDVRVDGVLKELDPCESLSGTCNYIMVPAPQTLELVEVRRYDADATFLGGARFDTVNGFTYTVGTDYDAGDVFFIDLTTETPTIMVPGA